MGIFDFFKSKEQREQEARADAIAQLMEAVAEMGAGGVDADQLPNGHGAFGLCVTNPVPTSSILGSTTYLARLRLQGRPVTATRVGSTSAPEITDGAIDIYRIAQDGRSDTVTLFLCPYHRRISALAPQGFTLA